MKFYEALLEALNESSYLDARPGHSKILEFIDSGYVDASDVLDELLRYLPDDELREFAEYYGENFLGIGDDWE